MKTIFTIAKREWKAYFVSPIAYIFLVTFLVITHWLFLKNYFLMGQNNLRVFFNLMPWVYLFFMPAVAMGKWSEERKQGTIELLFTLPVTKRDVVLGKFFASLGLLASALLLTFPLPLTVAWLGNADWGPIIGGYLGLLLMGAAYLAIGLWISALTVNQIIAFILGVVACFALFIIGEPLVTSGLPQTMVALFQNLSLGNHFESIGRGVVDSRDMIYYASVIGLFLFFNRKAIEFENQRWVRIATVVIGLFTLNLLASRYFLRWDLTAQKRYTLAPATKNILKNLEDVATIRLYFSRDLPPSLLNLRREVEDLLQEFKTYSHNKIRVEFRNPQENPIEEEKVKMLGIPALEVNVIRKDKQEVAKIYLGMTIHYGSQQEVLPIVQDTGNLEYRLAADLIKISRFKQPDVGFWAPSTKGYDYVNEILKARYKVHTVSEEFLDKLDAKNFPLFLFFVPENLSDAAKKAFENYLENGGKAIVLLENMHVDLEGLKPSLKKNPLEDWLKKYGLSVPQEVVMDASNAAATFTGGPVQFQIPYPYWVKILGDGFNPKEPLVSELNVMVLPWASPIQIPAKSPEGVTITPLLRTTKLGQTRTVEDGVALDPHAANQQMAPIGKNLALAVSVLQTKDEKTEPKFVLAANTHFLQNPFLEQFQENALFLENALDVLSLSESLLGIRAKGSTYQPLPLISDSRRAVIKGFDLFLSPVLLMIGGLLRVILSRRRRIQWLQTI